MMVKTDMPEQKQTADKIESGGKIMKAKKMAIFLISASLTMGIAGATAILADPPAMGREIPQAPDGEAPQIPEVEVPQAPDGKVIQAPDIEAPRFPDWHRWNTRKKKKRARVIYAVIAGTERKDFKGKARDAAG